jgi:hypothetical protein
MSLFKEGYDERQEKDGGCQLGIALPRLRIPARSARLQASPSTFLGRFSLKLVVAHADTGKEKKNTTQEAFAPRPKMHAGADFSSIWA